MTPKEECEALLDALIPAAENLLRENGQFYPIGAALTNESTISLTSVSYGDDEFPESQRVIDDLTSAHCQMAEQNEIKASGIAWDATITAPDGKKSDAILISLEHVSGYSVMVGVPYVIGMFKKVKLGELFAQSGLHNVFQGES